MLANTGISEENTQQSPFFSTQFFINGSSWFFMYLSIQNVLFIISGISDSYQMGIFRILAGILHLGNVEFASRDSDSCAVPVSSGWAQVVVSALTILPPARLQGSLLKKGHKTTAQAMCLFVIW